MKTKKILSLIMAITMITSAFAFVGANAAADFTVDIGSLTADFTDSVMPSFPAAGYNSHVIKLGYNVTQNIGSIDLAQYDVCIISYGTDGGYTYVDGDNDCIGIKTSATSYGWADQALNAQDDIASGHLKSATSGWASGTRTITLDISESTYNGSVYLASYNKTGCEYVVSNITFASRSETVPNFFVNFDAPIACGGPVGQSQSQTGTLNGAVSFVGWFGSKAAITGLKYSVNGGDLVESGAVTSAEDAVVAAVNANLPGAVAAKRFSITVPGSEFSEDNKVYTIKIYMVSGLHDIEIMNMTNTLGTPVVAPHVSKFNSSVDFINGVATNGFGGTTVATRNDTINVGDTYMLNAGWVVSDYGFSGFKYQIDDLDMLASGMAPSAQEEGLLAAVGFGDYAAQNTTARFSDASFLTSVLAAGTHTLNIYGVTNNTVDGDNNSKLTFHLYTINLTVAAPSAVNFEYVGTSIRTGLEGRSGMRFMTKVSIDDLLANYLDTDNITTESFKNATDIQFGTLLNLVRLNGWGRALLSFDSEYASNMKDCPATNIYNIDSNYIYYTAVLTGIPSASFGTTILARPYVKITVDGTTTTYYADQNLMPGSTDECCVTVVAQSAVANPDESAAVISWINTNILGL